MAMSMTPHTFRKLFDQKPIQVGVDGLVGRVMRGRTPLEFFKLSNEPGKRLSWIVGPDSLQEFLATHSGFLLRGGVCCVVWLTLTLTLTLPSL